MGLLSKSVSLSVRDGLATLRIAREHGNAINSDMVEGLQEACQRAAGDPAVRGVMLASAGRLFCPGLDLQELVAYDRARMDNFMARFGEAMLALYTLPKPLLACIAGHALAGGCLMAITADRRVLRRGSLVGLNEVRVGVPLPYGLALMLRESVHIARLEEVALLGRNYTDDEAVATGLVHELHGGEGIEDYCRESLQKIASRDIAAFATTKGYLRSAAVERIRAADLEHRAEFLDCWFAETTRRRIEAIVADLQDRGS